jgi:peptidoglycan/LPS O-acetylase OafA/YrhL
MPMISLGDKLAASGERPTGFDYLRISLALGVVCMHSGLTSYGQDADFAIWMSPLRPVVRVILPMFFALSGFLVAGSLLRTATLMQFLGLRAIRIYPALAVEVFLSALLLGPLLTTEPLGAYFTSPLFGHYLMNATGHIHYVLPGVFQDNPFPNVVNAQLWTVPFELLCYISLSVLALIGVKKRLWLAPAALVALMVAYPAARILKHHGESPVILGGVPGAVLVLCFLAGVSAYFYKDRLPWSAPLCILSGLATALLLVAPYGDYVVAPVVTYFTVSLGLANPRKLRILQGADYSYGIFLYGFAIQQTLMQALPWARIWWVNILLSVALVTCFAAASWHLVEKPALKLRRFLQPRARRQRSTFAAGMTEAVDPSGAATATSYSRPG